MPEVAQLICDEPNCRQVGIRYWYYTVAGKTREVIFCPDHNIFAAQINPLSRPARDATTPRVKRRPSTTPERLDAMHVDDTEE